MNIFRKTQPQISRPDMALVEETYGFRFPQEAVSHYLQYNGGIPERRYWTDDDGTVHGVQVFLSIKYGLQTMEEEIQAVKVDTPILPDQFVPFALDSSGNYFCFSLAADESGYIYYWDNENYDDYERAATLLDHSLTHFIDTLKEEPSE